MDIILRSDVETLGLRGEVVSVADGYARNFLLPRKLAERATPARVAEIRRRDENRARQEARNAEQAQGIADVLGKTVLRFEVKAGAGGSLFGSVTPTDIADEIWRVRKVRVDRRKINLPEPIRRVGRYSVPIEVFADVDVEVKTLVVPEGGELPPEEELLPAPGGEETGDAPGQGPAAASGGEETGDAPGQGPAAASDGAEPDAAAAEATDESDPPS